MKSPQRSANLLPSRKEIDQVRYQILSELLLARFEDLAEHLGFSITVSPRSFSGPCPIHAGSNCNALLIYRDGDIPGKWMCFTRKCEDYFARTLLGFLRGVLSSQQLGWSHENQRVLPWPETIAYACDFLGLKWSEIQVNSQEVLQRRFSSMVNSWATPLREVNSLVTRDQYREMVEVPPAYFLQRGYSDWVLDFYDVGLCKDKEHPLFGRVIVPIYEGRDLVGMTARAVCEACSSCGLYHGSRKCPKDDDRLYCSKWRHHPVGFPVGHHLYNSTLGLQSKKLLIVEGPGCVWRVMEAGFASVVATFGSKLADSQQTLLELAGVREIYVGYDNDRAGDLGFQQIQKAMGRVCRVKRLNPPAHDFGGSEVGDIQKLLSGAGFCGR